MKPVETSKHPPNKTSTESHKLTTSSLGGSSSSSSVATTSTSKKKPGSLETTTEKKAEPKPTPSESSSFSSSTTTTTPSKKHDSPKTTTQSSSTDEPRDEPTPPIENHTTFKTYTTTHSFSSSSSYTSSSSITTTTPKQHESPKPQHSFSSSSTTSSAPIQVETPLPSPATSVTPLHTLKSTLSTTDICLPTNIKTLPPNYPEVKLTYTTWSTATPTPSPEASPRNHKGPEDPHKTKDNKLTATATIPFIPIITGEIHATGNGEIERAKWGQMANVTIDGYIYQLKRGETAVIFVDFETTLSPTLAPTPVVAPKAVRGSSDLAVGRQKRGDRPLVLERRGRFKLF